MKKKATIEHFKKRLALITKTAGDISADFDFWVQNPNDLKAQVIASSISERTTNLCEALNQFRRDLKSCQVDHEVGLYLVNLAEATAQLNDLVKQ